MQITLAVFEAEYYYFIKVLLTNSLQRVSNQIALSLGGYGSKICFTHRSRPSLNTAQMMMVVIMMVIPSTASVVIHEKD
jgi:hypothetical protein